MPHTIRSISVAWLAFAVIGSAAAAEPPEDADDNLYWPGDFEGHLYGGSYSSDLNVTLTDRANHTPGGSHAWALQPATYQHLELLTPTRGDYELQLMARAASPVTLQLKLVSPAQTSPDQVDPEAASTRETVHKLAVPASAEWRPIRLAFSVDDPYPGPLAGETLLGGYNPSTEPVYIDDVRLRRITHDPLPIESGGEVLLTIRPEAFATIDAQPAVAPWIDRHGVTRRGLVLHGRTIDHADATGTARVAHAEVPAGAMRGRRVLVEIDATLLSSDPPMDPWAALVIDLQAVSDAGQARLTPTPGPHWMPMGQAPRPGSIKTTRAAYDVPGDADRIRIDLIVQDGVGDNAFAVTEIRFAGLAEQSRP